MAFNLFIINDEIIFDANSCEVKSLDDADEIIMLNAPTARCLQLLIEKRGEVVSRDCFLEQVWQARGIVVSQNTFYQNISLLRKSLKSAGLKDDIIVTVRRKGFTLAADTRVQPVEDVTLRRSYAPASDATNEKQPAPVPEVPNTGEEPSAAKVSLQQPTVSESKIPKWLIWLLVLFIVLELISLISGYVSR